MTTEDTPSTMTTAADTPRGLLTEVEQLLYREARLLDTTQLEAWLELFTDDGLYWIPIDENKPTDRNGSLVRDDTISREERVYHLLETPFPAQAPGSRLVHLVTNVEIDETEEGVTAHSSQVVYEVRAGDFRQVGLGKVRAIVSRVEHRLVPTPGGLRIKEKKILLIDRDMPQSNLTFII